MRRVYKYELVPNAGAGVCRVKMPIGATVLMVGAQGDELFVWALVAADSSPVLDRTFYVFGTGHDIANVDLAHVGSAMMHGGELVFHVFEEVVF